MCGVLTSLACRLRFTTLRWEGFVFFVALATTMADHPTKLAPFVLGAEVVDANNKVLMCTVQKVSQ